MKSRIVCLALGALVCSGALAEETKLNDGTILVYGESVKRQAADKATVRFSIEGFGNSLSEAFLKARTHMDSVRQDLFSIGLRSEDISTDFFRGGENYGDKAFLSSRKDYNISLEVDVRTTNHELLEPILNILANRRVERINAITFELTTIDSLRREASTGAVTNAELKADALLGELQLERGRALEVTEIVSGGEPLDPFGQAYRGGRGLERTLNVMASRDIIGTTTIHPREVSIEAKVGIVFEIVDTDAAVSKD